MIRIYIYRVGFETETIDGTSNCNVNKSKRTCHEYEHQPTTVTKIRRETIETEKNSTITKTNDCTHEQITNETRAPKTDYHSTMPLRTTFLGRKKRAAGTLCL